MIVGFGSCEISATARGDTQIESVLFISMVNLFCKFFESVGSVAGEGGCVSEEDSAFRESFQAMNGRNCFWESQKGLRHAKTPIVIPAL